MESKNSGPVFTPHGLATIAVLLVILLSVVAGVRA